MQVAAAVICDFAEVREGLLTIVSAGITRLYRNELPAPMNVFIALLVQVTPTERSFPHELTVVITAPSEAEVARATGAFQVGADNAADPDENILVPMPLDLRNAGVTEYGRHTITISIDGAPSHTETFAVTRAPAPQPVPGPVSRGTKPN